MGQGYTTHLILLLDPADKDAKASADRLVEKGLEQGKSGQTSLEPCTDFSNESAICQEKLKSIVARPLGIQLDERSKVTVVGHGDDDSTYISHHKTTPLNLARLIAAFVKGKKVNRISLAHCRGGGHLKAVFRGPKKVVVSPERSFAFEFAAHFGYANTITARTEDVHLGREEVKVNGVPQVLIWKAVGANPTKPGEKANKFQLKGHRALERKVIFTPNTAATPKNRINPTWKFETYDD